MTAQTPTYLKAHFENGDIPNQTDYGDVFDSFLNIAAATTTEQTIYGPLKVLGQITATNVSAQAFTFTSIQATDATFTNLTAVSANISNLQASTVSAATVSANNLYVQAGLFLGTANVSAVGSTQAQAATLTAPVSFVIYADLGDVSVKLGTSTQGKVQTVINATTTVIRIFPAVSARFLTTAVNTSINIPADKVATVYHKGDDRYGIQIA